MARAPSLPWALDQLVKLHRRRPDLVDGAIARLVQDDPELRWSLVVSAYLDDNISLAKAAELLDLHALELRDRFIRLGIPLRLGPADMAEARAEVDALTTWLGSEIRGSSE